MRRTNTLPSDWKQRVEGIIRSSPLPNATDLMLQLLGKDEVVAAAEVVWNAGKNQQEINENFPRYIQEALFRLVLGLLADRGKSYSAKGWRSIAEALEKAPADDESIRDTIRDRIRTCRLYAENASKTRPRKPGYGLALVWLRQHFQLILGDPLNEAVGYFLEAAFGGKSGADTVAVRASEMKRKSKGSMAS